MAQVTLQAVVNFEQVNQLQQKIDKLNGQKITIQTKEFAGGMREAATAAKDLGDGLAKVTIETKGIGQMSREIRQYKMSTSEALTVTTKFNKATKQYEESTRYTRNLANEQREAAKAAKEHAKYIAECVAEYEKYKAEIASVKTPLQQQIDAITGVTRATTNAKENYSDFGILLREQAQQQKEASRAAREAAKAQEAHTDEVKKGNDEVKKQGLLYDILGRSVSSFLARMAAYRAVYAGIRAITNGFKEALDTLKAVDDELVTVRKVTGFDAAQMAGVESQAYAVASKYGASAADYTSSVAAFARAGYKEVSTDLAELAEKTKIVGDTTADVAQQFLLSVDAAYQYRGNIEKLNAVLDGANEIDNKFATSIEKIAEGMGIVAPVAAQMNVSVDELAAGIGTITAVTQRSGTEAARALRAIFLNIVGDTKTEIDEGVTWTTGEIAGLRDVIKLYAKDAYDAAQEMGEVIDPMRAIAGLAQSVKDGVLSEAKLTEMVSDIGGKLRTSQLLAIVNNWDMYESMLQTYRTAYGSADKEIDNAMDSWTRKTNVLKNTWTEFVKTGLNSTAFKGFLDILTKFIEHLGTLGGAMTRLIPLVLALRFREMAKSISDSTKAATGFAGSLQKIGVSAKSLNWISAILAAIAAAWSAVSYAVEDAKIRHQQAVEKSYEEADAAKESADRIFELSSQMETATANSDDFKNAAKELADTLKVDVPGGVDAAITKLREYRAEALALDAAKTNTAALNAADVFLSSVGGARKIDIVDDSSGGYNDILQQTMPELWAQIQGILSGYTAGTDYGTLENAKQYRETVQQIVDAIDLYILREDAAGMRDDEYYKSLVGFLAETETAYKDLEEREQQAFDAKALSDFMNEAGKATVATKADLNDFIGDIINSEKYTSEEKDALIALANEYYHFDDAVEESTDAVDANADSVAGQTDELYANQKALGENATAEERLAAAKKDAEAAARKLIPALWDENGALSAAGIFALEADKNLAGMVQSELEAQLAAKKANYSALVAQLAVVGITAAQAAQQIWQISRALAGDTPGLSGAFMGAFMAAGGGSSVEALLAAKRAEIQRLMSQLGSISVYSGGGSSGGGSSGGGSSGGGGGSGHSGSGHSGSGHSGGGSSSSSTEDKKLTALQDRVKLLKSELSLMKERGDSEEDQIAKMREIQEALRKEYEYLESIKGDQTTINNLYQEWYSYANQISDLEKQAADEAQKHADAIQAAVDAQKALDNILKNRSVRVYNASTGQWEWQADPAAVASAQSDLDNAIASAGYTQDAWALLYSMLSGIGAIKDNWLNSGPGAVSTNFGGNSYGNTYNFGSIRLSEAQAQSMTVAEFARLANALPAFNNSP